MKQEKFKNNLLKKVGQNIRDIRREKGLSQESLAFEADLDRSYIGGVERGDRNIAIINLKKIADVLKIPLS
jgi:transcriptional regulator with XRE-family HTH domain